MTTTLNVSLWKEICCSETWKRSVELRSALPVCLPCSDWLREYGSVFLCHLCTLVFFWIGETWFQPRLMTHPSPSTLRALLRRPKSLSPPVFFRACPPPPPTLHPISFLEVAQRLGSPKRVELECRDAASVCATMPSASVRP